MSQIAQIENRWQLSGDIVVDNAKAILTASLGFTITNSTKVDFADSADIDTTALSLILEWKRRAQTENKTLSFINLPANLSSLAALYGVEDMIN
ncbi:MAG: STAS domain-containing protein [Bdellovibrio sp.]|nr:STAS domain-containing protein [Methylotenera sp.]